MLHGTVQNSFTTISLINSNNAYKGVNYVDISGDGHFSQSVVIGSDSKLTFGGHLSRRDGGSASGFNSIWDAANATLLFSSPSVPLPITVPLEMRVPSFGIVSLPAGSYTFRGEISNLTNADDVSFSPEAASSVLGMSGMLTLALRRRRH